MNEAAPTSGPSVPTPRRLALLIHDLQSGGAQRVMCLLANAWAEAGWEVHLLTLDGPGAPAFFPLDPRVRRVPLGAQAVSQGLLGKVRNNFRRVLDLRRTLRDVQPEVLISFIDKVNVLGLLASRGLGLPVVISERVDPRAFVIGPVWNALRRITYPWADRLVVQVEAVREFFPARQQPRIQVIPNPVPVPATEALPAEAPRPRILAAGRLDPYKGFDLLLEAFARVAPGHPAWSLDILGEGHARADLERRVQALGLEGRVRLPGNRPDILAQMRGADLFVLSSRAEGFPNVLCEAMAAGLPVLSFDCPTGPADIVRQEVDGLLVPAEDAGALAEAMDRLLGDAALRLRLAGRAPEVLQRFSLESVLGQWEACLGQVLAAKGR